MIHRCHCFLLSNLSIGQMDGGWGDDWTQSLTPFIADIQPTEWTLPLKLLPNGRIFDQWEISISLLQVLRPCLNELQKDYCMKTKVIALDWQWVTLRSWCQMNRNGDSSPVKYKVDGKPHKILEKLKITSGKYALFGHFFGKYFLGHLCSHLYFP